MNAEKCYALKIPKKSLELKLPYIYTFCVVII